MNRAEYEIMYRVEDRHWWYIALRGVIDTVWPLVANSTNPCVSILDVGCGTGAVLASLDGRAKTYGLDFAPEAIHFCRARGQNRTAVASAVTLPFADASFDAVISCDVLCHRSIQNKQDTLEELVRVLRPGGRLVLNLPAYQWLYSSHDAHVHTDHRFTRGGLVAMLHAANLTIQRLTYWNTLLLPPIIATRLWRKIRPLPASDLDKASGENFSPLFNAIMAFERGLLRRIPLPAGLSIFVVAQKP